VDGSEDGQRGRGGEFRFWHGHCDECQDSLQCLSVMSGLDHWAQLGNEPEPGLHQREHCVVDDGGGPEAAFPAIGVECSKQRHAFPATDQSAELTDYIRVTGVWVEVPQEAQTPGQFPTRKGPLEVHGIVQEDHGAGLEVLGLEEVVIRQDLSSAGKL